MAFVPFAQYTGLNRQDSFSKSFSATLQMKKDFPVGYLIHGPPIITHAQEEKLLVSGFWKQINESAFVCGERGSRATCLKWYIFAMCR